MTMCARRMDGRWRARWRTIVQRWGKGPSVGWDAVKRAPFAIGDAVRVAGLGRVCTVLAAMSVAIPMAMASDAAPTPILPRSRISAQCAHADAVLAQLRGRYGEIPFWIGNTGGSSGNIVLTRRRDGGSWTLLAIGVDPDGVALACMISAGTSADPVVPTQ